MGGISANLTWGVPEGCDGDHWGEIGSSNMGQIMKDFEYFARYLGYDVGSVDTRESLVLFFNLFTYSAAPGLSCSTHYLRCCVRILSCSMWDLVP